MGARPKVVAPHVAELLMRVRKRQLSLGYDGNYRGWIKKVTPPDLQ
jgi:hypothetical protein